MQVFLFEVRRFKRILNKESSSNGTVTVTDKQLKRKNIVVFRTISKVMELYG